MPNELFVQKATELQKEFLKRLSFHNPPLPHFVPSLLLKIIECDEELLEFSLGKIGQSLKLFTKKVDFQHPEILSIFDGLIADNQIFAQNCIELITLAELAKKQNLFKIMPYLGKVLINELKPNIPQNNKLHVRLLIDDKEREEIRLTKRMQFVDLQGICKKGKTEAWDSQPDDFSRFLRFDTSYQDEIKLAEKKATRYEELGCSSMAKEIRKSIESFNEHMEQSYYGFNRILMVHAALILAKSLEFSFELVGYENYKILVNQSFFGKYNFDPEQAIEFSPYISRAAGSPIFTPKNIQMEYEPRIYPLHEFIDIAPQSVKDTISLLEKFPDAGEKPIFDHFGLIVPSVSLPKNNDKYSFLDEQGLLHCFSIKEEALKAFDKILIKGNYIYPIVVAERDGKCYFVSYFL